MARFPQTAVAPLVGIKRSPQTEHRTRYTPTCVSFFYFGDSSAFAATLLAVTMYLAACNSYDPRRDDPVMRTWEQNRWSQLYKLIDANNDGQVTREEQESLEIFSALLD